MPILKIFKDGQFVRDVELQEGQEYIAGRSESCNIPLDPERGISRQHFKVFNDGMSWLVRVLSRYGEFYHKTEKVQELVLEEGLSFQTPPYEFVFFNEASAQDAVAPAASVSNSEDMDFSDKTTIGIMPTIAFLRLIGPLGGEEKIFQLDGHHWLAGRDVACSIYIDKAQFSRRHFEIKFEEGVYLIRDLESVNGTSVNGHTLAVKEWVKLSSGDLISVVDWSLVFEIRDSQFEKKMQEIVFDSQSPVVYESFEPQFTLAEPEAAPVPVVWTPQSATVFEAPPPSVKMNPVRLLIFALLIGGGGYYFYDQSQPQKTELSSQAPKSVSVSPAFDKLKPEQQSYVRESYRLAESLFKQGRYELARQEITKIHELVPSFEDSKTIEKLSDVAIQTQIEQKKAEAREKEKIEVEEKIQKQVKQCKAIINKNIEMSQLDNCLSPVIAFNPDHPDMVALKGQVEKILSERVLEKQRQADYQARVRRHRQIYEKAANIERSGRQIEAIQAYEDVVKSSLPDPGDLRGQARRNIASIQQNMADRQSEFTAAADAAYKKGDLKTAIKKLEEAVKVNPDNEVTKGRLSSIYSELRKQMQVFYQEGILEESVGEVESAKEKWKKIRDLSVPNEDYYKKATMKLKKYGGP